MKEGYFQADLFFVEVGVNIKGLGEKSFFVGICGYTKKPCMVTDSERIATHPHLINIENFSKAGFTLCSFTGHCLNQDCPLSQNEMSGYKPRIYVDTPTHQALALKAARSIKNIHIWCNDLVIPPASEDTAGVTVP